MLRTAAAALVVFLVACSSSPGTDAGVDAGVDAGMNTCLDPDAGPYVDAGNLDGGDLSCLGQALPITAVAQLGIGGFVTAAGLTRNPVPGSLVEMFDENGVLLGSVLTSTDGGRFELGAMIDCAPLAGSMRASKPDAGFYDNLYYPPEPWRRNRTDLELSIFDQSARMLVTLLAGVTVMPNTGALAVAVEDCTRTPIAGAKVTTSAGGDIRYVGANGIPSAMLMETTGKGQLLIFNVPPGMVTLTATINGQTLRTKTVAVRTDVITATTLLP